MDDARDVFPVGSVLFIVGTVALSGFLKINGAELSRVTYQDLYLHLDALGLAGPGDGSTTFDLPDWRAEYPRFWDDGRGIDVGRVIGSWQAGQIADHAHTLPVGFDATRFFGHQDASNLPLYGSDVTANARRLNVTGIAETGQSVRLGRSDTAIQSQSGEVRTRNISILPLIKY